MTEIQAGPGLDPMARIVETIRVIAVACFPPTIVAVLMVAVVVAFFTGIGEVTDARGLRATTAATLIIRGAWLLIAVAGLNALINDIADLT